MHQAPVVLGIDFGGSKTAVAVADVDGVCTGTATVPVLAGCTAEQNFRRALAAAHALLAERAAGRHLAAVGAATFGIPYEDRVDLAPNVPGWAALAFGRELRAAFPGAAVRMATDVKAAAAAELADGALAGADPGLYLNLGTGLAVAIVVGSTVLQGRHGAAGEIGYSLRRSYRPDDLERLEDAVSGGAFAALARRYAGGDIDALFRNCDHDPHAAAACTELLAELAFHLVNLVIAVDPQRVVVGGGLTRSWDRIGPPLAAALGAAVPYPPELVLADHPLDAPLRGALALARSAAEVAAQVAAQQPVHAALIEGAPA